MLLALAVGLYACAPLAVLLQVTWTRIAAWSTGTQYWDWLTVASYTGNPFIEEVVKVLPLVALLLMPVIRRQMSYTDCLLIGSRGRVRVRSRRSAVPLRQRGAPGLSHRRRLVGSG